ncbi:unnamed protein product [Nezara viridula]|uniref:Sushi domain-containing protein n=1 Tax=Nezara viridula TaxID=85310 RepID=A0A9P0E6Y9_NEZVI|nr:unnamed protein product [Nezara viridula]
MPETSDLGRNFDTQHLDDIYDQAYLLHCWAIAPEERDWKYRLSIYYTKPQDSGVFTCSTPRGLTNSLPVFVTDVQCGRISGLGQLRVRMEGTRLGQSVHFHCPTGFRLNGTANLTCRASGEYN